MLPSGKAVEVVYFEDHLSADPHGISLEAAPAEALHLCDRCDSALVYPLEWDEASATEWEVTLRCPNCELRKTGIYEQAVVESFDAALDRATQTLTDDLKRLTVANMEDEIDRFAAALSADQILPEDF